jgi:hypothetical protein
VSRLTAALDLAAKRVRPNTLVKQVVKCLVKYCSNAGQMLVERALDSAAKRVRPNALVK